MDGVTNRRCITAPARAITASKGYHPWPPQPLQEGIRGGQQSREGPPPLPRSMSRRAPRPSSRRGRRGGHPPLRTLTFKFRVSPKERAIIRERARGYASPAEYARRTLVAGWSPRAHVVARVTDAFVPLQEVIDRMRAAGLSAEADAATDALREILDAVSAR